MGGGGGHLLESMHFNILPLSKILINKELRDTLSLVSLKLKDLTELLVNDHSPVAAKLLLEAFQNLPFIVLLIQPLPLRMSAVKRRVKCVLEPSSETCVRCVVGLGCGLRVLDSLLSYLPSQHHLLWCLKTKKNNLVQKDKEWTD